MDALATIRPDDWSLPLFLHILGAMVAVGGLVLALAYLAGAWRGRSPESLRAGFRALLWAAIPGFLVMRVAAQWLYVEEHLDDLWTDPDWIGIGFRDRRRRPAAADHRDDRVRHRLPRSSGRRRRGHPRRHRRDRRDPVDDGARRAAADRLRDRALGDDGEARLAAPADACRPARFGIAAKEVPHNRNRHSKLPEKPVDRELLVSG